MFGLDPLGELLRTLHSSLDNRANFSHKNLRSRFSEVLLKGIANGFSFILRHASELV